MTLFIGPMGRLCDVCEASGHPARNPIDLCGAHNKRATCYRNSGHEGNHVSSTGREWSDHPHA